jgi:hypothetical protein
MFPFIMQIGKMAKNWRTPNAQPSLPPCAPSPSYKVGHTRQKVALSCNFENPGGEWSHNAHALDVLTCEFSGN